MQTRLLLTGASLPQTERIFNPLNGTFHVFLGDSLDLTGESFIPIPQPDDTAFAHKMLKICLDHEIKVVVPQVKQELNALAPAKTLFAEYGIAVLCPEKSILDLLNDKSLLYTRLEAEGFAVPAIQKLAKYDSFVSTMLKIGYPSKKIRVEPLQPVANNDFRIVDDSVSTYGLLFPDPQLPLISYTQLSKLLSGDNFPVLLLSELIEGNACTQVGYFEQGICKTNTADEPDNLNMILMQLSSTVADILKLSGNYELDFVQTQAGFYFIGLRWMLADEYLVVSVENELAQLD